ncbi:MAG: hypothetical protein OXT07_02105 [bacterium]|nr:hypothetical protein [bacterium]
MSVEVAVQAVTLVLAVLAIIWHQQRTSEKLRDDFTRANNRLRDDFTQANNRLRDDFTQANNRLRDEVVANGQRLARIEGFLGVGMPTEVAEQAAGTATLQTDG